MNTTEKDILKQLSSGSEKALEQLYHYYGAKLYNFIMKLSSGNSYMAEELVQRAFIKVWENRKNINPEKSFISYLCTIAKNMLFNEYEHKTIEYVYQEYIIGMKSESDNTTEKDINLKLLEEYIDKLANELPPARKKVFVMSRREMLSNKEIAKKLGIAESTVQTQLQKALSFIKEKLNNHYESIILIFVFLFHVN